MIFLPGPSRLAVSFLSVVLEQAGQRLGAGFTAVARPAEQHPVADVTGSAVGFRQAVVEVTVSAGCQLAARRSGGNHGGRMAGLLPGDRTGDGRPAGLRPRPGVADCGVDAGGDAGSGVMRYSIRGRRLLGIRPQVMMPAVAASKRRCSHVWMCPRVCGGTAKSSRSGTAPLNVSPRVRGNRRLALDHLLGLRSIPACAGEPGGSNHRIVGIWFIPACWGTRRNLRLMAGKHLTLSATRSTLSGV